MRYKKVFGGGLLLLGNSDIVNRLFLLVPHSLVIFFLFVEVAKELKRERKKDRDTFKFNFYFGGGNVFLNQ